MTNTHVESYDNVWDAIADTAGEAANMQSKAELMCKTLNLI